MESVKAPFGLNPFFEAISCINIWNLRTIMDDQASEAPEDKLDMENATDINNEHGGDGDGEINGHQVCCTKCRENVAMDQTLSVLV